ncbi:MAG: lipase family protein [Cocleimonas sp.]
MIHLIRLLLISFVVSIFSACGGGSSSIATTPDPNPTPEPVERGSLISANMISSARPLLSPYKVDAYKIIYNTINANNKAITASGLLSIPEKAVGEKSPILSYQHGTIFLDVQAPSRSASSIQGINILAGMGYIVSASDYIGYVESSHTIHPYHHADSLASASLDMLKASKVFLGQQDIQINNQLFLAGYSEGGYATLALQKAIQDDPAQAFITTASAAGAGAFDLSETAKTLANQVTNNDPSFLSFLIKSYDTVYSLNKITEIYQPSFQQTINTHFDGTHSGGEIDRKLSHTTAELFNPEMLSTFQGDGSHVLKDKLALNDIYDWKPNAPTRFYHSPNDEVVPYSNAVKALQTMQDNGAENISLSDCSFGSHVACAIPYVFNTVNFFSGIAEDL